MKIEKILGGLFALMFTFSVLVLSSLAQELKPGDCPPGSHFDKATERCKRDVPLVLPSQEKRLPPPPGVTVLQPGGKRVQASICPEGFIEHQDSSGWRFCIDPAAPEPIPPLMVPPIAGVSYETALKIMNQHRAELEAIPGVRSVGMGENGIVVETNNPGALPAVIEGIPVEAAPLSGPSSFLAHTGSAIVRPLRSSLMITTLQTRPPLQPEVRNPTLTGVAYGQGTWLIMAAHALARNTCSATPFGCVGSTVNQCVSRYNRGSSPSSPASDMVFQPNNSFFPIGRATKWSPVVANSTTYDVAAVWMDNNLIHGDSSVCAIRDIEQWTGVPFTGLEAVPSPTQTVYVISANSPHVIQATVLSPVDVSIPGVVAGGCVGAPAGSSVTTVHQVKILATTYTFNEGDSGAPIITPDGKIVGMLSTKNNSAPNYNFQANGTLAVYARSFLGFSKWYGNSTFPYNVQACQ